jgi:hypothetical protein
MFEPSLSSEAQPMHKGDVVHNRDSHVSQVFCGRVLEQVLIPRAAPRRVLFGVLRRAPGDKWPDTDLYIFPYAPAEQALDSRFLAGDKSLAA